MADRQITYGWREVAVPAAMDDDKVITARDIRERIERSEYEVDERLVAAAILARLAARRDPQRPTAA